MVTIVKLVMTKEMMLGVRLTLRHLKVVLAGWPGRSETLHSIWAAPLARVCASPEGAHLTAAAQMVCLPLTNSQLRPQADILS